MTKHVTGTFPPGYMDQYLMESWQKLNDKLEVSTLDTTPFPSCVMEVLLKLTEKLEKIESTIERLEFNQTTGEQP